MCRCVDVYVCEKAYRGWLADWGLGGRGGGEWQGGTREQKKDRKKGRRRRTSIGEFIACQQAHSLPKITQITRAQTICTGHTRGSPGTPGLDEPRFYCGPEERGELLHIFPDA